MSTALATIENITAITAIELFKPGTIDVVVEKIETQARNEAAKLDISTETGRKAYASLAYAVARSKTYIDDSGKSLGEDLRDKLNAINDDRKKARERLDALKIEVRKPLTDLEKAEDERKAGHEDAIKEIAEAGTFTTQNWQTLGAHPIRERISEIERDSRKWEEFEVRAAGVKALSLHQMGVALKQAEKAEVEAAELARLRCEAAERAIQERETAAAKAAKEKAEQASEAERQRLENERLQAEARAKQAEAQRIAAEQIAERRAREAAEEAERDKQAAVEAERQRVFFQEKAEKEKADARARNKAHILKVDNEVLGAITALDIPMDRAQDLIIAIRKGDIPHITINY
jgi:colicin import membrane protein